MSEERKPWPTREEMDAARAFLGLPPTREPYDAIEECRRFLYRRFLYDAAEKTRGPQVEAAAIEAYNKLRLNHRKVGP